MSLASTTRKVLKRASVQLFMRADRLGIHVTPKHYYSSLPDYRWLSQNSDLWRRPVDMTGVRWEVDEQLQWLHEHCSWSYGEVRGFSVYRQAERHQLGFGYGPVESQVLHGVCRTLKPARWIEVGSGTSTFCALHALNLNQHTSGSDFELTCIEPYPRPALAALSKMRLITSPVQGLHLAEFEKLRARDVLFIDSTHSVKTGSDVCYLLLEVLPRLSAGVLIHIHDIFLPYLYRPDILDTYFDWQETSLLLALLKGNPSLQIRACLSGLHYEDADGLKAALPDYNPEIHFPSSIWLEVVK